MESSPENSTTQAESTPAVSAGDAHADLTDDLSKQLEDIISTYQADEAPDEPEDNEEVQPNTRREQKLEKKMLKSLGRFCTDNMNRCHLGCRFQRKPEISA